MSRSCTVRHSSCSSFLQLFSILIAIAILATSCSRDPNVRKQKYFESGQRYFDSGKYREAMIEFSNAVKIDPSYARAHYRLAETYLRLQQSDRASSELALVVELQPDNFQARMEMTNLLILGRNFSDAQQQTFQLEQSRPNDPAVHSLISSLYAGQGNIQGAIEEMQKAVALDPSRWQSRLSLAMLQLQNNDSASAEANLKKVTELNPQSAQAQMLLGDYYESRGNMNEAAQSFQRAISADPKNPDARAALARFYLSEGKKAEAEDFLRQAKKDFPDNPAGYRLLGDFYFATGDLDNALAEYASLYRDHPTDLQLKKNYIELLIEKNQTAQARNLTDEILKKNPNDSDALVYRSQMQISDGQLNDAISTLQTVIKNDPNHAEAHYVFGIGLEKQGNLERAESEWREAVRLRPNLLDAHRALAAAAMRQGDMSSLDQSATRIISLQPGSPEGYGLRALSNINRQHFSEAEEDIRKAIALAPQSSFGYLQMGNLRSAQKRYPDAAKAYQEALDRSPNSSDALRGLMNSYLLQKQTDLAISAANAQIAKSPSNDKFYDLLGTTLFKDKKDAKGAEAAFTKAIQLDPNNSDAIMKLGQVEALTGKPDQAIALYQKAIRDQPHQTGFFVLLGQLYESKQDWKSAQDAYQGALAINPQDPFASDRMAQVMLRTGGNLDVALSLAQTARRSLPNSPDVADTLGQVFYQKGVYGSAVSTFEEALKLAEKNKIESPDIHYHLGLAYQKTDQPRLARQHLERALKISPNYSAADDIKKQLAQLTS